MEIDIFELPIPDWGLNCPSCQYLLKGLPAHRCPECGAPLDMRQVVRPWTRLRPPLFSGRERPLPDFGLQCGICRRALVGANGDSCPSCGCGFDPLSALPRRDWFNIAPALVAPLGMAEVEMILAARQIPHVPTTNRDFGDTLLGTRAVGGQLLAPREFFFELLATIQQARREIAESRGLVGFVWHCPECGEENPGNFEMCWKCQHARQQV